MSRLSVPTGHGEVLTDPPYAEWGTVLTANLRAASAWRFEVAGVPASRLRLSAHRDAAERASAFSARLGVPVSLPPEECPSVVMTGHQPGLYHPGVWAKVFLLQRLADETGAVPVDLVVDTDGFDAVAAVLPCMRPGLGRCRSYLALGGEDSCYACAPPPEPSQLEEFRATAEDALLTLPAPALLRHLRDFCEALRCSAGEAGDLAESLTFARRRYEAPAGTTYLELPVSLQAKGKAFLTFLADIAYRAPGFFGAYNSELRAYRRRIGSRSAAQPFPDLGSDGELLELPFWTLSEGRRSSLWIRPGPEPELHAAGSVVRLPSEVAAAPGALAQGPAFAPKALSLTAYNRMFTADLLIHGVGGGRYDEVTDRLATRFYGVEPPRYVTASLTMYLPLGGHLVSGDEVRRAEERLNRIEHNPDQLLAEADLGTDLAERASGLAAVKARLVAAIARPGADKKTLGAEIRGVNAELSSLLAPMKERLQERVEELRGLAEASEVLTDRTYPFCLWSPQEVQDKVR